MSAEDEILELHRQQEALLRMKLDDVRHDLRAAIGKVNRLMSYPVLTAGDVAALIGWKRTLEHMEGSVSNLQTERSKRVRL